jgi:fimbrial chaperone protein
MRFHYVVASVLASAAACWLPPASAGSFGISPIRLELSTAEPTGTITVRNEEDAPALIQAEAFAWSQGGTEDNLDPTQDLIVSPGVFTLPPKATQLVRVALRRPVDPERELSYRLILQEVPPEASPDFTGLRMALRLSMPVFVEPPKPARPDLEFSAARDTDGRLVLRAENRGTAHARIIGFALTPIDGDGATFQDSIATYVLPGQARTWTLQNKNVTRDDSTALAGRYRLKANTERGEVVTELTIAR